MSAVTDTFTRSRQETIVLARSRDNFPFGEVVADANVTHSETTHMDDAGNVERVYYAFEIRYGNSRKSSVSNGSFDRSDYAIKFMTAVEELRRMADAREQMRNMS